MKTEGEINSLSALRSFTPVIHSGHSRLLVRHSISGISIVELAIRSGKMQIIIHVVAVGNTKWRMIKDTIIASFWHVINGGHTSYIPAKSVFTIQGNVHKDLGDTQRRNQKWKLHKPTKGASGWKEKCEKNLHDKTTPRPNLFILVAPLYLAEWRS